MAIISIGRKDYSVSNRSALKIMKALHQHFSTHCLECDKAFVNDEPIIDYSALIPGNQGLLCVECAELLNNIGVSVEEMDASVSREDGKTDINDSEDSPTGGEQTSSESST